MSKADDWISCGEAERLVNAHSAGNKEHKTAFSALLWLASHAHIPVRADVAECWTLGSTLDDGEWEEMALDSNIPFSNVDLFFHELIERYNSGESKSGFCSFATGAFNFFIWHRLGGEAQKPIFFEVIGMQFGRASIVKHFGSAGMVDQFIEGKAPDRTPKRPGRTKGSGSFAEQDLPLLQEMHAMIVSGKATSPDGAAGALADRAHGRAGQDSKKTRLAKRYRAWLRESEPN